MLKTIVIIAIGVIHGTLAGMLFIVLRDDWRKRKKRDNDD